VLQLQLSFRGGIVPHRVATRNGLTPSEYPTVTEGVRDHLTGKREVDLRLDPAQGMIRVHPTIKIHPITEQLRLWRM
jgi:hypothetical protein